MKRTDKTLVSIVRPGFTLLEVSVAIVLLVVLMAVSVQVLGWVAAERTAAERRLWATEEAANVMERLATESWNELTSERAASLKLSDQARDMLPDGELVVTIRDEAGDPASKRLVVEVRWKAQPGQAVRPVRLTAWVFRPGGSRT